MSLNNGSPRVMFLSANAGTGHSRAAMALEKCLMKIDPEVSCQILNSYKVLNFFLEKLMDDGYIQLLKYFPGIYGFFYERKNNEKVGIRGLKDWLNRISARKMKKLIDEYKPDLIVCTHAFPCGVLSVLKREHGLSQKVCGVVTDFVVSPFWLYPETDLYMVANEDLRNNIINNGISREKVLATGIPIDPKFVNRSERSELCGKLNLNPDLPILLVMGGGLGMRPVTGIISTLKKVSVPFQAVLGLGKNEQLRKQLEESLSGNKENNFHVKLLSYVDNIDEYMKVADLLITKPGGMTLAEAMAVGLPAILTSPIPGQEMKNVSYLSSRGVGEFVRDEKNLASEIERLLSDSDRRSQLSRNAEEMAKPRAAEVVAEKIYDEIKKLR